MLEGTLIGLLRLSQISADQNCDSDLELWSGSCQYGPIPEGEKGKEINKVPN